LRNLCKEKENAKNKIGELKRRKEERLATLNMERELKEKLCFISEETKNCPLCGSPLTDEHRKEVELKYTEEIAESKNLLYKKNLILSKLDGEIESIQTALDAKMLIELKENLVKYTQKRCIH